MGAGPADRGAYGALHEALQTHRRSATRHAGGRGWRCWSSVSVGSPVVSVEGPQRKTDNESTIFRFGDPLEK